MTHRAIGCMLSCFAVLCASIDARAEPSDPPTLKKHFHLTRSVSEGHYSRRIPVVAVPRSRFGLLFPQAAKPSRANPNLTAVPSQIAFPPALPGGKEIATDSSEEFLKPPASLLPHIAIARTPPTVDFMYFPGQTYAGRPWSNWGDSLCANDKYYASIGDHLAPAGNAFVYQYDPATQSLRQLLDLRSILKLPDGHYSPGKIHGRLDMGSDGWLYFSTHRGSTKVTTDEYHYRGDWIVRHQPQTGESEVLAHGPVSKHCIPTSVLDPQRLIFYGGTAPGSDDGEPIRFFAFDVRSRRLHFSTTHGPARYMIFAPSTGRIYYTQGKNGGALMRYDPKSNEITGIDGEIGIRAATQETPDGYVYTVSEGRRGEEATIYRFHTATESIESLGTAAVGSQNYIASIDADPSGRFLYYIPGAHGNSDTDGSPVVQFDVQTRRKKVIAFLHPYYATRYGCSLKGTYSSAVDSTGAKLYITWNASRSGKTWDCCALTVVHIPESER